MPISYKPISEDLFVSLSTVAIWRYMNPQKSITICKFVINRDSILTPRAGSGWGLYAARETRQGVWQRT